MGASTFAIIDIINGFYSKGIKPSNSNREGDVAPELFKKLIELGKYDNRSKYINRCTKDVQFLLSLINELNKEELNKEKFCKLISKLKDGFEENIKQAGTENKQPWSNF